MPPIHQAAVGFMQGASPAERFIIAMLSAQLGPEKTQEIADQVSGKGVNVNTEVAGYPLHRFLGKTERQIRAEIGDDKRAKEVLGALEEAGFQIQDRLYTRTSFEESEDRGNRRILLPSSPPEGDITNKGPVIGAGGMVEATFGAQQIPVSELWGLSREELLDVEGVSEATADEIYRLRDEYNRRVAGAAPNAVVVPAGATGPLQSEARRQVEREANPQPAPKKEPEKKSEETK